METAGLIKNEECLCQNPHGFKKETVTESDAAKFMPQGLKALFLSDNESLRVKFSKLYRLYTPDGLLSGGTPAAEGETNGENPAKNKTDPFFRDFKKELKKIDLPEDIRLVISEGNFNALGKYAAHQVNKQNAGVKHIVCGGGNLSRFDYIREPYNGLNINKDGDSPYNAKQDNSLNNNGGAYRLKKFSAASAVFDSPECINAPSGFAFVINMYLSLFDWDIATLLYGGKICDFCFREAQKTIHRLLEAARTLPKRSAQLKKEIFSACLSAAELIETAGPPLLQSGAMQTAAALSMLLKHEERPAIDFFEASFLLLPSVAGLYALFLEEMPFSFPPDFFLHATGLTKYLGINESESINMPSPYLNKKAAELANYRLRMYRNELKRHIYDVIRVVNEAYPIYFRLFEDDGFWLKDFLNPSDISLSLALSGDVLCGDTLLQYILSRGLLDRYIN